MDDRRLQIRHHNLTLHWVSPDVWLASRGYQVWSSATEGSPWTCICSLKNGLVAQFARHPFIAQAGRLGIQNLIQLSSGTVICVADGVLYRSTDLGTFAAVFSDFQGRRPLRMGICQDSLGRICFGEYLVNPERRAIHLWRSEDDAQSWHPVFTWPSGTIAHIHFVQFDPYEQALWVGTGDEDHECQFLWSSDGGVSFDSVGGGTQLWRAGSILFTREAIFWGTDIGIDHNDQSNYIVKLDRKTRSLQKMMRTEGPAYYSTQLTDGTLVVGTCVERANRHNDRCLHLYWTRDQGEWNNLRLWPKMPAPKIIGPATLTFPLSDQPLRRLLFNANGTRSRQNGSLFEVVF